VLECLACNRIKRKDLKIRDEYFIMEMSPLNLFYNQKVPAFGAFFHNIWMGFKYPQDIKSLGPNVSGMFGRREV